MRYAEFAPPQALADGIASIWELDAAGTPMTEPIFPDGRVEVIVHLGQRPTVVGARLPQPAVMVVGQMTTGLRLEGAERMRAVGIRFTPSGARSWLGLPMDELTSEVRALDDVAPRLARELADALDGRGLGAGSGALEAVLRSNRRFDSAPRLVRAVDAALARGGALDVDALARLQDLSPRQLERQFLDGVGLPPKRFLRIVRFQRALGLLRGGCPPVDVAARCGYADQPHLAREFRAFAGVPASEVSLADVAFLTQG